MNPAQSRSIQTRSPNNPDTDEVFSHRRKSGALLPATVESRTMVIDTVLNFSRMDFYTLAGQILMHQTKAMMTRLLNILKHTLYVKDPVRDASIQRGFRETVIKLFNQFKDILDAALDKFESYANQILNLPQFSVAQLQRAAKVLRHQQQQQQQQQQQNPQQPQPQPNPTSKESFDHVRDAQLNAQLQENDAMIKSLLSQLGTAQDYGDLLLSQHQTLSLDLSNLSQLGSPNSHINETDSYNRRRGGDSGNMGQRGHGGGGSGSNGQSWKNGSLSVDTKYPSASPFSSESTLPALFELLTLNRGAGNDGGIGTNGGEGGQRGYQQNGHQNGQNGHQNGQNGQHHNNPKRGLNLPAANGFMGMDNNSHDGNGGGNQHQNQQQHDPQQRYQLPNPTTSTMPTPLHLSSHLNTIAPRTLFQSNQSQLPMGLKLTSLVHYLSFIQRELRLLMNVKKSFIDIAIRFSLLPPSFSLSLASSLNHLHLHSLDPSFTKGLNDNQIRLVKLYRERWCNTFTAIGQVLYKHHTTNLMTNSLPSLGSSNPTSASTSSLSGTPATNMDTDPNTTSVTPPVMAMGAHPKGFWGLRLTFDRNAELQTVKDELGWMG